MKKFINTYVDGCDLCQRIKTKTLRAKGPLQPLSIPEGPWQHITYDLITGLLKCLDFGAILVVIDRLSKEGHFIATNETVAAVGITDLFLKHIWKHHRLPLHTTSD